MSELDDRALQERLDPDGTLDRIHHLPEHCLDGWQATHKMQLPAGYDSVNKIVIVGMGGSAVAGDFLQALAFGAGRAPVTVVRGYDLPAWMDADTLAVFCSHSGNTEETLSAFEQSRRTPVKSLVITTGGRLPELAEAAGIPIIKFQFANEPRSAFGHNFLRMVGLAVAAGKLSVTSEQVEAAVAAVRELRGQIEFDVPEANNPAKQLARALVGSLPLAVASDYLAPAARRFRTQLNEYPDMFSGWDEIPELNHNLVVGLRFDSEILHRTHAVFFDHAGLHPRNRLRYDLTTTLFEQAGIKCTRLTAPVSDRLAAQLWSVHFGDFVSYYMCLIHGVRPMEVDVIDWLKAQLAE